MFTKEYMGTTGKDFDTTYAPTWCPGCGNYAILNAIKAALADLDLKNHEVAISYGIGCAGNMNNLIKTYGIHTLHGRSLPVAEGIKLSNRKLKVIAIAGDGDAFGIGANHFIQLARRNIDVTYIVCDNHRYSLTTGQTSPTTDLGDKTKTSLYGNIEEPFNPLTLALASDGSFVSRGFAGMAPVKLKNLIKEAINHKGFSLVDVLLPCVTFNDLNTFPWYIKRVYELDATKYRPNDRNKAFVKAQEWGDKIPLGVFYKSDRLTYEDQQPQLTKELVDQDLHISNLSQLMDEFV
ncbi:MAG: thiamine pyrophosphate-dependent enzyme [Patescibacteria group bacterium]|jgi:2-oxoglutarate ferredoxin oxidoreductase subunit beta